MGGVNLPNYQGTGFNFSNGTVGDVVTALLPYVYGMAGLILLLMLIYGGIVLMTAAGDPGKSKTGYGVITNALVGFAVVFISYLVVQLVETILGVGIL